MYAAISPSKDETPTPKPIIVDGRARLSFVADADGMTRLDDLFQRDPQRILFPNPPKDDITQAVQIRIFVCGRGTGFDAPLDAGEFPAIL